jgi:hypothetical protein
VSSTRQASRREQAREAARQAEARNAGNARLAIVAALAVVAAAIVGLVVAQGRGTDSPTGTANAGGLLTGPPPWPAQPEGLAERVAALRFPPVGDESYHAHALLAVYRDGQQVPVPADLGYDETGAHSSLHTHTPDGVIHMEADDPYPYRLSHVMTTWGVAFDADRLGGDTAAGEKKVHVYVNGEPAAPDVELKDGDNVVVAYGTAGSFPTEPPADALENA